jgi:hypothetical protein
LVEQPLDIQELIREDLFFDTFEYSNLASKWVGDRTPWPMSRMLCKFLHVIFFFSPNFTLVLSHFKYDIPPHARTHLIVANFKSPSVGAQQYDLDSCLTI